MLKRSVRLLRSATRVVSLVFQALLTRTVIEGRENIPTEGPVIVAPNHFSTYDATVFVNNLPLDTALVGPGDFRLLFPANVFVERYDIIMTDRGAVDRGSLTRMVDALKQGRVLALFPEGGTWEKTIKDAKPGAAYLAMTAKVPVIPVAIGGTYQVWQKIFTLQWPRIYVKFGKPIPPPVVTDRKQRQQILDAYSLDLMQAIYDMLPAEDKQLYDRAAQQVFSAEITDITNQSISLHTNLNVIAELVMKPNLVSPLHRNAKLPILPLVRPHQFYTREGFLRAVDALLEAFQGEFDNYIPYRLGDKKAKVILDELQALRVAIAAQPAGATLKFKPIVSLQS